MTPAAEKLAAAIRASGPISFRRFMEVALYDADFGYYRRPADRDPFGKSGDFFTAEQLQPVFGILIAARIRQIFEAMGAPAGFTVVELGAGRGEMADAFSEWRYVPVDVGAGALPDRFTGVVFSNEFFDALPIEVAVYDGSAFRERVVALAGDHFAWQTGEPVRRELDDYFRRYFPPPEPGRLYEANLDALRWLERVAHSLDAGFVLSIDYGYTRPEAIRFPEGTLMGYRRHSAREDVLTDPGVRDITAHVNFTALEEHGAAIGLARDRFETLAQTILAAGEPDQFAAAMAADPLQLKTLLFGMGETFRVLLQKRVG